MAKQKFIQIKSKNALLELLNEGRDFERIYVASTILKDDTIKEILAIARQKNIPIHKTSRKNLDKRSKSDSHESIIGLMNSENQWRLKDLLDHLYDSGQQPFFLVFNNLHFAHNVGAVIRTGFAGGVNGIISPIKRSSIINDEVMRVSIGAVERIPYVEMNLFTAINELKDNGVKVFALETGGKNYFEADLRGPVAFVLGAEDTGISSNILERCDEIITLPMREGIGSINVGASAAVIIYEKLRQEVTR